MFRMEGEFPKDSRKNQLDSSPSYTQVVQAPPEGGGGEEERVRWNRKQFKNV